MQVCCICPQSVLYLPQVCYTCPLMLDYAIHKITNLWILALDFFLHGLVIGGSEASYFTVLLNVDRAGWMSDSEPKPLKLSSIVQMATPFTCSESIKRSTPVTRSLWAVVGGSWGHAKLNFCFSSPPTRTSNPLCLLLIFKYWLDDVIKS